MPFKRTSLGLIIGREFLVQGDTCSSFDVDNRRRVKDVCLPCFHLLPTKPVNDI